jgi:acyl carrier protein
MTATPTTSNLEVIQDIFREIFLDDSLVVTKDTSPLDIEEWDSLAQIDILAAIESSFNIRFTADEMSSIKDVAALLEIVNSRHR